MTPPFIDELFKHLTAAFGLRDRRLLIESIRDIFFEDFDITLLRQNQKFDFSFSLAKNKKGALRFSYNDFREEKELPRKIRKLFSFFGKVYRVKAVDNILGVAKSGSVFDRLAAGCDWPHGASWPRIKLYLYRESMISPQKQKIAACLKNLNISLGWPLAAADRMAHKDISVVAVDFYADRPCDIKTYTRLSNPTEMLTGLLPDRKRCETENFLKTVVHEKKSFFYVAQRWSPRRKDPVGLKLHKIYETNQIPDARPAQREISGAIERFGFQHHPLLLEIKAAEEIARRHKMRMYPAALSLNTGGGAAPRLDVYQAFMPQSLP